MVCNMRKYEDMELILSTGSAINTKTGMVYPLKKASGDILWNEGFSIVDAWYDYDNNYKWFLQIDVWDKQIVNEVILRLITKNVKKKSLAITRAPQLEVKNYKRKKK